MGVASKVMGRIPVRLLVPAIAWQYRFNEPELARFKSFVPADRGAVDVGVWWGPWSWWLARRVPHVDSFEANLEIVKRLEGAMPHNVRLHPIALSDTSGEATLWVPAGGMGTEGRATLEEGKQSSAAWEEQATTTRRLDDLELGDVGFVKIDVEGHELSVLKGARQLLIDQRPNLLIEVEEHSDRRGELDVIIEFLRELSYRGTYWQSRQWHPIEELDRDQVREMADRVARYGYLANLVLHSHRYVHNFLFTPS